MKGSCVTRPLLHFTILFFASDKTLPALCKSIKQQLVPEPLEAATDASKPLADKLPTSTLERAILSVAERVNYGADPQLTTSASGGTPNAVNKVPANLCLWRWEVKDRSGFPAQLRERVETRRNERVAAKQDLAMIIDALPDDLRASLFGAKPDAVNSTVTPTSAKDASLVRNGSPDSAKEVSRAI